MKKFIPFLLLAVACSKEDVPKVNEGKEVTLYNQTGQATAYYVVENEEEQTVYRWTGEPTTYFSKDQKQLYGYNGKPLGWFEKGVLYDLAGNRIAFQKDALPITTQLEPVKYIKHIRSVKRIKEISPAKPVLKESWSTLPLDSILVSGDR